MKLTEIVNTLCCAMYCTHFTVGCLQLIIVTNVLSMPTDEAHYFDDETSGSGNDYENYTSSTSQMIDCLCNDTNVMVDKKFLVKWLRQNGQHSISKLSVASNKLKDDTEYLQVCVTFLVRL